MIHVHRIHDNGSIVVNADLIETVEACPDTVITLVTKRRFIVADSLAEVLQLIVDYRAAVAHAIQAPEDHAVGARALVARNLSDAHDQDKAA